VRTVRTKDRTYLVVGPGMRSAQYAILQAALRAAVRPAIDTAWSSAGGQKWAKAWDGVKSPRLAGRYGDGKGYFAETLARAVTFKVRAKEGNKDTEDDFAEDLNKDNLRWGRAGLRVIESLGGESFEAALPKALAKVNP
jgi:hypothetical protein